MTSENPNKKRVSCGDGMWPPPTNKRDFFTPKSERNEKAAKPIRMNWKKARLKRIVGDSC